MLSCAGPFVASSGLMVMAEGVGVSAPWYHFEALESLFKKAVSEVVWVSMDGFLNLAVVFEGLRPVKGKTS